MKPQQRYQEAHYKWQLETHREFYERSGCYKAVMPKLSSANGLTKFIVNYINWSGGNATRISSAGRYIEEKNSLGQKIIGSGKFIPSATKRGTADITATINGRSVKIEIKVGNDKPSEWQLKEQERERKAGGIYEFISKPEQFFLFYDKLVNNDN